MRNKKGELLTKHHLFVMAKNGGIKSPDNLLKLWDYKHLCWHQIFAQAGLDYILQHWNAYRFYTQKPQWKVVFKNLEFYECKQLLQRVRSIKKKLRHH